jgi:acetyl-CoA carboxylase biotin carboxyl carrier protein
VEERMNIKEIEQLLQMILGTDIEEMEISRGPSSLKVRRRMGRVGIPSTEEAPKVIREVPPEPVSPPSEEPEKKNVLIVSSPLVGTFYRAPAPDANPFVEVGETVSKGQVLCIVEAMKLMNEIHAEENGRILAILVENGHPVEYGEPLFEIEKV